jgi:hypothetical protein
METLIVLEMSGAPWRCAWCGAMREGGEDGDVIAADGTPTDGICETCLAQELSQLALIRATDPEMITGLRLRKRRRRAA